LTISDNQTLPNVIIVMDEAFSDLSMLGDLQTNEDPLEYCHLLNQQDNVISGKMDVSVWGGYTCNTEFEVLTGNSLFLFNGFVIPYNNLISENTDSLCSYFHTLGYTNIAIHPFWGQCWRRDIVYG
ncbi:MAG TPA: LTA synthase family protein, partial [Lachnospiraceae bacterium]|nr:LTA synthase family protein [Lachnospiraceae bacterium]